MTARIARDSLLYFLSSIIVRMTGLITLPIMTRVLTPEEYGAVAVVSIWVALATALLGLGHETTIVRYYLRNDRPALKSRVSSSWFTSTFWGSLAFVIILALILLESPAWFEYESPDTMLVIAGFATIPPQFAITLAGQILRIEGRAFAYTGIAVMTALASVAASVIFVVFLKSGPAGVFYGGLLGTCLVLPTALYLARINILRRPDTRLLQRMWAFGLPLSAACAITTATQATDRILLHWFGLEAELGFLAVAYSVASAINIAIQSFVNAWHPTAMNLETNENQRGASRLGEVTENFAVILGLGVVGVAAFAPLAIGILAGPKFFAAAKLLPGVGFAIYILGFGAFVALGAQVAERTHGVFRGALAGFGVNLGLGWILIPAIGVWGAITSTLAGNLVLVVTIYRMSVQVAQWSRLPVMRITQTSLVVGTACLLSTLAPHSVPANLVWGPALLLFYLAFIATCRRPLAEKLSHLPSTQLAGLALRRVDKTGQK
ncbi:MAG: oligosaccharide flippase family protein [Methyloligellaceae bacterium]